MRTVFNNSMLAHVYANQAQKSGRGSSCSFEDDTFYSYSTPIARIMKGRHKTRVMLVSANRHSMTTKRHINNLWSAWRNHGAFIGVPFLGRRGGWHTIDSDTGERAPDHRANIAYLTKCYTNMQGTLLRMRSEPHDIFGTLEYSASGLRDYCAAFGFKFRLDVAADAEAIRAKRETARIKRETPAYLARKAAKERAQRERDRLQAEAYERRRIEYAQETAKSRQEWLAGEPISLNMSSGVDERGSALLRLKPNDPATVQTSLGAEVPADDARKLLRVLNVIPKGTTFDRYAAGNENVTPARVGHFTLDRVDAEGNVRIGCHTIMRYEIDRFATILGQ